jgi:hypothetical protein
MKTKTHFAGSIRQLAPWFRHWRIGNNTPLLVTALVFSGVCQEASPRPSSCGRYLSDSKDSPNLQRIYGSNRRQGYRRGASAG